MKKVLISFGALTLSLLILANLDWSRRCDYGLPAGRDQPAIGAIVAFAFGNRIQEGGHIIPGPTNQALGEATAQLYRLTQSPIYAQWEVAETLSGKVPDKAMHAIYPEKNPEDGGEIYLSTAGIIEKIKSWTGDPRSLGALYVVAHKDHLCRCVEYLRKQGYDAYASPLPLPDHYDSQSAQPWTRSAKVYRLVDRLASLR